MQNGNTQTALFRSQVCPPPPPVNTSKAIDISSIVQEKSPSLRSNKTTEEETTWPSGFNIRMALMSFGGVAVARAAPLVVRVDKWSTPPPRPPPGIPGRAPLSLPWPCLGTTGQFSTLREIAHPSRRLEGFGVPLALSLSPFFLTPSLSSICQRDALLRRDSPRGDKLHNTAQPRASVTTTGWTGRPT